MGLVGIPSISAMMVARKRKESTTEMVSSLRSSFALNAPAWRKSTFAQVGSIRLMSFWFHEHRFPGVLKGSEFLR
jgi:hypothetical protein